jgi:hypothetical protein
LTDTVGLKRYLAYLEGGLLPIISLTSLHFFVKYDKSVVEEKPETEEYFNSRNKYMEKMVSERESVITKDDEISKKDKVEMDEEIIKQPEVDDIFEEISKSFDEQPDVTLVIPQKGDIVEEEITQGVVVKQPLTPPKTNIQRID